MAVTARMGLRYPVLTDSADVPRDIGNLAADIDAKAAIDSQGVLASRPTTSLQQGQYYFATDNNLLYRYNGSAWITLNASAAVDAAAGVGSLRTLGTGALQAAPGNDSRFASPATDAAAGTGSLRTLGTGALQAMAGNDSRVDQPGDLKETVNINALTGYLLCDGASYLRATYANLFAALGGASSTWGLPDGTHFNVPDFRGRSLMGDGTGAGLTNRVFGTYAGAETVTLTVANMPAHDHGASTGNQNTFHTHTVDVGMVPAFSTFVGSPSTVVSFGDAGGTTNRTTSTDSTVHSHPISSQGSGTAHANLHPVGIVHIYVKT